MLLSALFLMFFLQFTDAGRTQTAPFTDHPGQKLPYHQARLGGHTLRLMLARTPEEKMLGLMFYPTLADDEGMLFVYPKNQQMVFWMKNTLIPLDLIFFDEKLEVTEWIEGMQPGGNLPDHVLPRYVSRGVARYALELNAGSVRRLNIQRGQKLEIPLVLLFSREP